MIRSLAAAGGAGAAALILAACGSSSPSSSGATSATSSGTGAASAASVSLRSTSLGNILVDSRGDTLYLFEADTATTSNCTGACATSWPPETVTGTPTAGAGLTAGSLGTITRSDGSRQLEYHGHPLYRFVGDSAPGEVTGEGSTAFGAGWYVLNAAGDKVAGQSTPAY